MEKKDYAGWMGKKEILHQKGFRGHFHEREVWWCSIGSNVGHEEDGKHEHFERPVLILKKIHGSLFLGLPLSTTLTHRSSPFVHVRTAKEEVVLMGQMRVLSANRLRRSMWRMATTEFNEIRRKLKDCL